MTWVTRDDKALGAVGQSSSAVGLWEVTASGLVRTGGWSTPSRVTAVLLEDDSLLVGADSPRSASTPSTGSSSARGRSARSS
ncbi:hypothetical protein G7085_13355 [Tessaracoccus sp. HDW20]|uniref:hypothetical protein n=1 Tax=Tessaracoccus coleopterorum TaxID=2714950 RepID=UPI0018D3BA28|nr:hypothetical protein [Tessaracoccus coleopterorum]NHB85286.1 hypothetical protein [Tessaracoccus coleopterorum]